MRRTSTVLLFCALALAIVASVVLWRMGDPAAPSGGAASVGGPYVLTDQNGRPRSDRDFHGRWVLLYFGYTFCPDVCPTTLAKMSAALGKLGPQADRFVPVFITIDPERDTPSVLKTYLAAFGPQFVGLTGQPSDIARVAHTYRVYYAKHPLAGGNYAMDHSSVIYLLDPNGNFVKAYDDDASVPALAADLKKTAS
jgi:protein SCO1/2